ncbi:hypothetical protein [Paenibacillus sp. Soil522]|uniref:hypothetical protein n=1 Tax=Paenibacillus sp. Soil522 TaxID=1736388 RepID=UPI0006F4BCB3|nr:hypothetical protein [Paenibacillus sp. Soil522]KRE35284.1 hypothetical protein ASG81_22210 [Paenibacillus sp. Soil522]
MRMFSMLLIIVITLLFIPIHMANGQGKPKNEILEELVIKELQVKIENGLIKNKILEPHSKVDIDDFRIYDIIKRNDKFEIVIEGTITSENGRSKDKVLIYLKNVNSEELEVTNIDRPENEYIPRKLK